MFPPCFFVIIYYATIFPLTLTKGNEMKKSVDEKFDSYSREACYHTDRRHASFDVPQLSQTAGTLCEMGAKNWLEDLYKLRA
jgi:hypothetical protein